MHSSKAFRLKCKKNKKPSTTSTVIYEKQNPLLLQTPACGFPSNGCFASWLTGWSTADFHFHFGPFIWKTLQKNRAAEEGERREVEMWIWKPLEAGSCGLEWLIQRRRERRGRGRHMIAIMNLISVHVQVINAEPCDLAAGRTKNEKSHFWKPVAAPYNSRCISPGES